MIIFGFLASHKVTLRQDQQNILTGLNLRNED